MKTVNIAVLNSRIADGHPTVYNVTAFELGNEQHNPFFVDQVTTPTTCRRPHDMAFRSHETCR